MFNPYDNNAWKIHSITKPKEDNHSLVAEKPVHEYSACDWPDWLTVSIAQRLIPKWLTTVLWTKSGFSFLLVKKSSTKEQDAH